MTKLDWFNGNAGALDLYERLVFIAHTWDDLIDRDKPVGADVVNELMSNLLLHLPGNPFYQQFQAEIRALIYASVVSYLAANRMEQGSEHQQELAHYLRYAVSQIGVFMIGVTQGVTQGAAVVAEAMPIMIPERLAHYLEEMKHALAQE